MKIVTLTYISRLLPPFTLYSGMVLGHFGKHPLTIWMSGKITIAPQVIDDCNNHTLSRYMRKGHTKRVSIIDSTPLERLVVV